MSADSYAFVDAKTYDREYKVNIEYERERLWSILKKEY